jgi:putative ABC transport system substrate-binding protein
MIIRDRAHPLASIPRRGFGALALGAAVWPIVAAAESGSPPPIIAYVGAGSGNEAMISAFRQGMSELGHVEGQSFRLVERYAQGNPDRLQILIDELLGLRPAVFLTGGTNGARAILNRTKTVPIVVQQIVDIGELADAIVSLPRPGNNVTGIVAISRELHAKQLELMREIHPRLKAIAVLWDPLSRPDRPSLEVVQAAARGYGISVLPAEMTPPLGLPALMRSVRARGAEALLVIRNFRTQPHHSDVVAASNAARLPAIYETRAAAVAGGLVSYGARFAELYRRSASIVDRILKGARPADMPIEHPTKFELVINLKTAAVLGVTIPAPLLVRADEVIE